MTRQHAGLMASMVVLAMGCTQQTPGGPGVSNPVAPSNTTSTTANRPTYTDSADTFSLSVPILATHLKQGETKLARISLSRGNKFQEAVTLKFENVPQGVTLDPQSAVIATGTSETEVKISAADSAAVGDFAIKIVGHPAMGADATSEMKLIVSKK